MRKLILFLALAMLSTMAFGQLVPGHVVDWVYPPGSRTVIGYITTAGDVHFTGTVWANAVSPVPTYTTINVDRATAGTLNIGPTNATAVQIKPPTNVVGNFTVNSTYFTVAAATGNTGVHGTLSVLGATSLMSDVSIGSPTITFTAASGNATFGGTLASGTHTISGGYFQVNGATSGAIKLNPISSGTGTTTIANQAGTPTITLPATTCTLGGLGLNNAYTGNNTYAGTSTFTGGIRLPAAGGAADLAGAATLTTGTVTVSTTAVTASSKIFLTLTGTRATTTVAAAVGTVTAGTSFVINGYVAAGTLATGDSTSVVNWFIVN